MDSVHGLLDFEAKMNLYGGQRVKLSLVLELVCPRYVARTRIKAWGRKGDSVDRVDRFDMFRTDASRRVFHG